MSGRAIQVFTDFFLQHEKGFLHNFIILENSKLLGFVITEQRNEEEIIELTIFFLLQHALN